MDKTPVHDEWCIVSPETCSSALRRLADSNGWTLLERIDQQRAARTVVAMDATQIAVEAPASGQLPPIAEVLASLDSTDRVVCILAKPNAEAERRASRLGIAICECATTFAAWFAQPRVLMFPAAAPNDVEVARPLPTATQ